MEIKRQSEIQERLAQAQKKEASPPTRSFRAWMAERKPLRPIQKKDTIFDLASKEKKKEEKRDSIQGGENSSEAPFLGVSDSFEILEVTPVEISSLIDEMADYILMESDKGVSKTTVKLAMEGTLFDGTEVVIDHYHTAPHSFNLHLIGTPEAIELFATHLSALQHSLNTHEGLKGFHVHLMPPSLLDQKELYARGRSKEDKKREANLKGVKGSLSSITKK